MSAQRVYVDNREVPLGRRIVLIPRDGEQRFHGMVNTDSTTT